VTLALHPLREAAGRALLCLHAVGGAARDFQEAARLWSDRSLLRFSGHGDSARCAGAAISRRIWPATDAALARIGPALLIGAGVGAYVALLLAGARPDAVPGALLLPGAGLEGGGAAPDPASDTLARWTDLGAPLPGCDPAVRRLERDIRPPDYAEAFARAARRVLLAEGDFRQPPWWQAVRSSPTALPVPGDLAAGLARLAAFAHD
jgi:pimeloyl-ACP methyl ester carboxylesterase